jgi:hypothetical protein
VADVEHEGTDGLVEEENADGLALRVVVSLAHVATPFICIVDLWGMICAVASRVCGAASFVCVAISRVSARAMAGVWAAPARAREMCACVVSCVVSWARVAKRGHWQP